MPELLRYALNDVEIFVARHERSDTRVLLRLGCRFASSAATRTDRDAFAEILNRSQGDLAVQPAARKNNLLHLPPQIICIWSPSRAHKRAYRDRHGRWAREAVDADRALTKGAERTAKRVVLTPRRWRQVGEAHPPMMVANKPGHQGDRQGNRNTIVQGMPGRFRCTVVTNARASSTDCTRGRGVLRCTRHSLRPIAVACACFVREAQRCSKTRDALSRVARMRRCEAACKSSSRRSSGADPAALKRQLHAVRCAASRCTRRIDVQPSP